LSVLAGYRADAGHVKCVDEIWWPYDEKELGKEFHVPINFVYFVTFF
jgi:hypothetical protein